MTETSLQRGQWGAFAVSARTPQAVQLALAERQRYVQWVARQIQ